MILSISASLVAGIIGVHYHTQLNKHFKSAALNVLKELKETMSREPNESRKQTCEQNETINKEIQIIFLKENQIEVLALKYILK
jgi:hypothetical protein